MRQTKDERPKVISIFHENGIRYKAMEALIENGPLTTEEIKEKINCYSHRIDSIFKQLSEVYFTGNTRCGVWNLEYQDLEARQRYHELRRESEKRKEERRRNQVINLPVNPDMPSILCVFRGEEDEHTAKDVWKNVGGNFIEVKSHLHALSNAGVLFVRGERPKFYRKNSRTT